MKDRRLVILSVPFARLIRLLMGPPVLDALAKVCDVVVVSPLSLQASFRREFSRDEVAFLSWAMPPADRPARMGFAFSELMRVHGYWRRFRHRGMEYYLANSHRRMGEDGDDKPIPALMRFLFFLASVLGCWSAGWRILDRVVGPRMFRFPELSTLAPSYRRVTLVQSANWGMQDRALAWHARKRGWRAVMIPYTTDQLVCNGYLVSDFDAVCVQGPFEERYAKEFHEVDDARITRLGSPWFRHIDLIAARLRSAERARTARTRTILFVGVSRLYYPRDAEYLGIETILDAMADGRLAGVTLVYRPVISDEEDRQHIKERWAGRANMSLQWPQTAVLGLEDYDGAQVKDQLEQYVAQLLEADLIVMASMTSLCLDGARLGTPSILYMVDPSGVLARRSTGLMFDAERRLRGYPSLPVVFDIDAFVPEVQRMLGNEITARTLAAEMERLWDYSRPDFTAALLQAIGD